MLLGKVLAKLNQEHLETFFLKLFLEEVFEKVSEDFFLEFLEKLEEFPKKTCRNLAVLLKYVFEELLGEFMYKFLERRRNFKS